MSKPSVVRVPVWGTALQCFILIYRRFRTFARAAGVPLVAFVVSSGWLWLDLRHPPGSPPVGPLPFAAANLVCLVCLTAFVVRWHQSILFAQPPAMTSQLFLRPLGRVLASSVVFFFPVVAPIIVVFLAPGPVAAIAVFVGMLGMICMALVYARCILVFSSAAEARPLGFRGAWRRMRGKMWRLVGAWLATFLLADVAFIGVYVIVAVPWKILAAFPVLPSNLHFEPPPAVLLLIAAVCAVFYFQLCGLLATVPLFFYRNLVLRASETSNQPPP